jgi:hypothetical protein
VRKDQAGSSFGTATTLEVNNSATATRRTLIQFDLASCSPAIASDAIVHAAGVRLTTTSVITTASRTYELRRVTGSWTEATTWANQPAAASQATSVLTINVGVLVGTTFEWAATRDVQAFVSGDESNLGWRLADTAEDGGIIPVGITFNSRQAANSRPQLSITYAP